MDSRGVIRRLLCPVATGATMLVGVSTTLGFLAPWFPSLEMINHFRPFAVGALGGLLALSWGLRVPRLALASAVLFSINLALVVAPVSYQAQRTSTHQPHLTVVTLNTWTDKGQEDEIVRFLGRTRADLVLLQEIEGAERAVLLGRLERFYPYVAFDEKSRRGPAILSRRPWLRAGLIPMQGEARPLGVWAQFQQDGKVFEFASVHTGNPFEPEQQVRDVETLIDFVRSRGAPIVLGGDFNLTPFSWKLAKLAHMTGLRWAQTFGASWPGNRLFPFVLLDHFLIPRDVTLVAVETGPRVGSDHLPIIAEFRLGREQPASWLPPSAPSSRTGRDTQIGSPSAQQSWPRSDPAGVASVNFWVWRGNWVDKNSTPAVGCPR